MITMIVSGNADEATEYVNLWRQVHGDFEILMSSISGARRFVYVEGVQDIAGLTPETHEVVFYGTCYKRSDFQELSDLTNQRGLLWSEPRPEASL